MTPAPIDLANHLRALEESLLESDVRRSDRLLALLADEFLEFGASGRVYAKGDLAATLRTEHRVFQRPLELAVWQLALEVALVTYTVRRDSQPPVYSLRSSFWRSRNGEWQMVFHQGTPRTGSFVVSDPEVMSGAPCIAGTRMPAEVVGCMPRNEVRNAYPQLTDEQFDAAVTYVKNHAGQRSPPSTSPSTY